MTKKTRTSIFLFLLILFLIIAPITVLYCLGWRFDWENKKIVQPGIFYFKVWPRNVEVYLDENFKKRTDIFFGSVLIEDLKPKSYNVEIRKKGYYSWQKNLEIKKREVTEAKNVVLIPQSPRISLISKNINDFFFSPDGKKIILKENIPEEQKLSQWELKLFDAEKNIKSHLISQNDLKLGALSFPELIDIKFSFDSEMIIIKTGAKERIYYHLIDLQTLKITLLDYLENAEKVFFHPSESKILSISNQKLIEFNLKTGEELSAIRNIIAAEIERDDIYYLSKEGFLFKSSNSLQFPEKLNIIPFEIKEETKHKLKVKNGNILLEESNSLFIFNRGKMSFEKLLDSVKGFLLSPDSQKLFYFNDHEIWVLFLEKQYDQPQKEAGEKLFITRFSEPIGNIFWYTNHYLIFNLENKIKVAEIDDRDKINIVDLIEFDSPKMFFVNKALYVLSENNFYASENISY